MSISSPDSALIQEVNWQTSAALISVVRRQVFIIEQGVPEELEWDREDADAIHVLAQLDNKPVATGRLLRSGHIGRMAVLQPYRGFGIGSKVLKQLLLLAAQDHLSHVILHAQLQAKAFYLKHDFRCVGEIFEEAGIPHIRMELYF